MCMYVCYQRNTRVCVFLRANEPTCARRISVVTTAGHRACRGQRRVFDVYAENVRRNGRVENCGEIVIETRQRSCDRFSVTGRQTKRIENHVVVPVEMHRKAMGAVRWLTKCLSCGIIDWYGKKPGEYGQFLLVSYQLPT